MRCGVRKGKRGVRRTQADRPRGAIQTPLLWTPTAPSGETAPGAAGPRQPGKATPTAWAEHPILFAGRQAPGATGAGGREEEGGHTAQRPHQPRRGAPDPLRGRPDQLRGSMPANTPGHATNTRVPSTAVHSCRPSAVSASRMRWRGASWPHHRSNATAPCWRSISLPSFAGRPSSRACSTNRVGSRP